MTEAGAAPGPLIRLLRFQIPIPQWVGLGHWAACTAQHNDLSQLSIALIAGLLLGGPVLIARDGLVIVHDKAANAYAPSGLPGRDVVPPTCSRSGRGLVRRPSE
ncbi:MULTISPECIES: hypothetical protein [Streptomyces]|uniref:Uncharacterized protein n=1 Tax=Streptomyces bottropensis ATCC 25435 TaxID=1054862 RepID=M3FTK9_9ACTN|nr:MULTISPECIES: hypothetical protein [Streptomyces]EMF56290.1 hypothetical protein SBD_2322 [Streptomyces bottropensis ATCC 25435]MZD16791.1 hypothetical protein [Streptomyces sp. SID5476]